jgi:uncharacterized membrane protein
MATTGSWVREYNSPAGEPYSGTVTAKRKTPPLTSTEGVVTDGVARLNLAPGDYVISAWLHTQDKVRAFIQEDVRISTQEGS